MGDIFTTMVTSGALAELVGELASVAEPLHTALSDGVDAARVHMSDHGLVATEQLPVLRHLARGHALHHLRGFEARGVMGRWRVGAPRGNARVLLTSGGLSLRVLRPIEGAFAPPPGNNYARREFYANSRAQLLGVMGSQLIALWNERPEGVGVDIRVVRPIGTWKAGAAERVDLDFMLPATGQRVDQLTFTPSDRDITLPIPDLDDLDDELNSGW